MNTRNGQLAPLKDRINNYQMAKRGIKIQSRRSVAQFLAHQNSQMAMVLNHFFNRGIFGRLKWLVTGR